MKFSRIAIRSFSVLLFLLGLGIALAASLIAAYQAAKFSSRTGVLLAFTLSVFFICIWVVTILTGKVRRTFLHRSASLTSASLTALFGLGLFFAVMRPISYPHVVPAVRANTQYWSLPTGSRIAYSLYQPPAGVPVRPEPIVFVHGGPGLSAFDTDHAFYRQFTQDGFRVYLYDQAGSGLSDRLPHVADYTVERFVADIEAIRQQIGAERLILIGHSMGGTLIAHYAAAHPDHVAKLIFHSPGPIAKLDYAHWNYERTDARKKGRPLPRVIAATILSHANWDAAVNLWPQVESGDWELATIDPGEVICKGQRSKFPPDFTPAKLAGMNVYPLLVIDRELNTKPEMDIRPQLSKLRVPAIALESECEFVSWPEQLQYRKSIPGLQEFYFPDAGHYINFSQPEKMTALIRSFLLDQAPPFPPYQEDKDPRPTLRR